MASCKNDFLCTLLVKVYWVVWTIQSLGQGNQILCWFVKVDSNNIKNGSHTWKFQFHFTAKFKVSRCALCKLWGDFGLSCSVNHLSGGRVNANPNVWMHLPSLAYINKTGNGEGNCDGEWNFCPGKEADIVLIASDKNKKDQKNLWSKLVEYILKQAGRSQATTL